MPDNPTPTPEVLAAIRRTIDDVLCDEALTTPINYAGYQDDLTERLTLALARHVADAEARGAEAMRRLVSAFDRRGLRHRRHGFAGACTDICQACAMSAARDALRARPAPAAGVVKKARIVCVHCGGAGTTDADGLCISCRSLHGDFEEEGRPCDCHTAARRGPAGAWGEA